MGRRRNKLRNAASLIGLFFFWHDYRIFENARIGSCTISVAREGAQGAHPPNWNTSNDENVAKSLLFFQFQFLLAFFAYNMDAHNNNEQ